MVARTNRESKHEGLSLIFVESNRPGYEPPRKLDKIGMHAQDTAELFFSNVKVPADNVLGEEGKGFFHLMRQLPMERLSIAAAVLTAAERCLEMTVEYAISGTPSASRSAHFRTRGSSWPR